MPRLIERFASTLGASQRANVETLLREGAISGEITSFDEFKAKLTELSDSINLEATPITSIVLAQPNNIITSASYNDMMRMIQLDLETVYTEIDNITKLTDVHRDIQDKTFEDIRNALSNLDNQISTLELLSNDVDYDTAQYNSFTSALSTQLSKLLAIASSLYIDPRTGTDLSNSIYEVAIDISKEGVTLPAESVKDIVIQEILLQDGAQTTESDLVVDPTNNDTAYALRENDGQYWVRSVLLLGQDIYGNAVVPPTQGVRASVLLQLSGFQEVNSIVLIPFTDSDFIVDSISYRDVDGGEFYITSTSTTLADKTTFTFSRVLTDAITINIRQKTYSELVDFFYSSAPTDLADIQSLATTSGLSGMEIGGGGGGLHAKGYLYTMGFDYIGVHLTSYRDVGIYVSQPLISNSVVTQVLVDAKISHPVDESGNKQGSVEAYLAKVDYDVNNTLSSTQIFPIPYSGEDVEHEELILNSGSGSLRFFPDVNTLTIYRDFSALTLGADYLLSINGIDFRDNLIDLISLDVASGQPQKIIVKILSVRTSSVYTASYSTITEVNGNQITLTNDGQVQLGDRSVTFTYTPDSVIKYSELYTIFLIRTLNYTASRESPILLEYSTKAVEV